MEAVRWVLGESSAKELRGDTMQDVIFNGSGNRKPISRASVELHFDNSFGVATGEWSQYSEIAVKRVLERDSGSSYYINNTQVRRRDVSDLFLGTGLGARAYAIIGQNTISRIVEAKPEELRIYLEEAAGISKYKERRRETELRLRDTRENLLRVGDILSELSKQIARLQAQAEVAAEYHRLQQALKTTQTQLWLLKKREAAASWEKAKRQVERVANDLEAQIAQLRKAENEIVQLRQAHYASTEAMQQAQGQYYEANARVSTLEQHIKHAQEKHERLSAQLTQLKTQREKFTEQQQQRSTELAIQVDQLAAVLAAMDETGKLLETRRAELPRLNQEHQTALSQSSAAKNSLTQADQAIQLESAHIQHTRRTLTDLQQRRQKLSGEIAQLSYPDAVLIEAQQTKITSVEAVMQALEAEIASMQQQDHAIAAELQRCQRLLNEQSRKLAQFEAQRSTLQKIQQSVGHEASMDIWLNERGLDKGRRFWECLSVDPRWESAIESALDMRLSALIVDDLSSIHSGARPPAAAVFCIDGKPTTDLQKSNGRKPLLSVVTITDAVVAAALNDWLANIYVLEEGADPVAMQHSLQLGDTLVNAQGDIYTRYSVTLYAPQSALHGVLERQRELAQIEQDLPVAEAAHQNSQAALSQTEQKLRELRQQFAVKQQELRQQASAVHAARLELQRLQQQHQHGVERRQRLEAEQNEIAGRVTALEIQLAQDELSLQTRQAELNTLRTQSDAARQALHNKEQVLAEARTALLQAERKAQESEFNKKIIYNKINELNNALQSILESTQALSKQQEECEAAIAAGSGEDTKTAFAQALELKHQREQVLAEARNYMSGIDQQLQAMEQQRLQIEQQLHPLRDKLEQSRLQEQQTRLHIEHCREEIASSGVNEVALEQTLPASAKPASLEQQAAGIEAQITQLGPVNLAAIQELESESERNAYLESQSKDLTEAAETLEDAIRRIDRETRGRLQQTFDEANRHFGELFQVLFHGGQARLQLLGEEILDTGVQVFAQPPGKKNSTIHLLSGGEKALTAIALVFALFKLNPAPFCMMDEVDAPLDDSNTERFCALVKKMSENTQFLFVSHNRITMEMAQQLIGVTMQESGVSRIVEVDVDAAMQMKTEQLV